jgi:cell division protein FtsX
MHSGDSRGQGSFTRKLVAGAAQGAFAIGCLLLVVTIFRFLYKALQSFFGTPANDLPRALLLAFIVIAVGMLIGALSLLLRFAERDRYDGRPPPSLVPALIIVALGVALGCVAALQ